jgi:hypothetical protein
MAVGRQDRTLYAKKSRSISLAGAVKLVLGSLVGDDQRSPGLQHPPDRAQHRDGVRQIVDRLHHHREVVSGPRVKVRPRPSPRMHPIGEAGLLCVPESRSRSTTSSRSKPST